MAFRRHRGFTVTHVRSGSRVNTGERQQIPRADRGARPISNLRGDDHIWMIPPTRRDLETQYDYMNA